MRVIFSVKSCAISVATISTTTVIVATPIRATVIITTISITIVGSKKSSSGPILRGMLMHFCSKAQQFFRHSFPGHKKGLTIE